MAYQALGHNQRCQPFSHEHPFPTWALLDIVAENWLAADSDSVLDPHLDFKQGRRSQSSLRFFCSHQFVVLPDFFFRPRRTHPGILNAAQEAEMK